GRGTAPSAAKNAGWRGRAQPRPRVPYPAAVESSRCASAAACPSTSPRLGRADRAAAREQGLVAELFFDAQELVVLGHAVRARQRAGLDLAAVGGDRQVGDGGVFGLARAVAHHGG